jgi:hypothetical protein
LNAAGSKSKVRFSLTPDFSPVEKSAWLQTVSTVCGILKTVETVSGNRLRATPG